MGEIYYDIFFENDGWHVWRTDDSGAQCVYIGYNQEDVQDWIERQHP